MSEILNLFPQPVYITKDYKLSEEEKKFLMDNTAMAFENSGKNFTSAERYILDKPELTKFKEFLIKSVNDFTHNELKINKKVEFYITQSWVNKNPPGTFHHQHLHYNSLISSVFFINGGSSPIKFNRQTTNYIFPMIELERDEYNISNSDSWTINNEENSLILFPSSLGHCVEENTNNFDRYTLSFNTYVKGTLGGFKEATELKL